MLVRQPVFMAEKEKFTFDSAEDFDGSIICRECSGTDSTDTIANGTVEINLDKFVWVLCEPSKDGYYHALDREEFRRIVKNLEEEFDYGGAVADVIQRIQHWKAGGSGDPVAARHEELLKDELGIHKPIRDTIGESDSPDECTEKEEEFIKHLIELSDAYVEYHHGDSIQVYRGYGYGLGHLGARLFDNPNADKYEVETTVLTNFTLSEKVANQYGDLRIELKAEPKYIALAIDHLLWHKNKDDWYTDAEVQLRGDEIPQIPSENLTTPEASGSIGELIQELPTEEIRDVTEFYQTSPLTANDLSVIATLLSEIGAEDEEVLTKEAKSRILNWYRLYSHLASVEPSRFEEDEMGPNSLWGVVKQITGETPPDQNRGIDTVLEL
jgi:hypothetical protein